MLPACSGILRASCQWVLCWIGIHQSHPDPSSRLDPQAQGQRVIAVCVAIAMSGGMKEFEEEAQVSAVPEEYIRVLGTGVWGIAMGHGPLSPLFSWTLAFYSPLLGPRRGKEKGCNMLDALALAGLALRRGQARQVPAQQELFLLPLSSVSGEQGKAWLKDEHPPMAVRARTSGGG